MNTRIEELLAKYWEGETSLSEENELRVLILESDDYPKEKEFFKAFAEFKSLEPQHVKAPQASVRKFSSPWIRWAASIALILGSFWGVMSYQQRQAEKKAYEEVMQAFAMIQTNLIKGKQQLQPLQDFKYLNTTNQLFRLDQNTKQ